MSLHYWLYGEEYDDEEELSRQELYSQFSQEQLNDEFIRAGVKRDWELVHYLLKSDELTMHASIHAGGDALFRGSLTSKDEDIIQHLIFELNIDITPLIQRSLDIGRDPFIPVAKNMIKTRDLNQKLQQDLNCSGERTRKPKI